MPTKFTRLQKESKDKATKLGHQMSKYLYHISECKLCSRMIHITTDYNIYGSALYTECEGQFIVRGITNEEVQ